MNKLQIQITEIDNGFIVAMSGTETQGSPPKAQFCENLDAIIVYLNQVWPKKVTKLSVI